MDLAFSFDLFRYVSLCETAAYYHNVMALEQLFDQNFLYERRRCYNTLFSHDSGSRLNFSECVRCSGDTAVMESRLHCMFTYMLCYLRSC